MTFILTDVEGSTRLWQSSPQEMLKAVSRLDALIPEVLEPFGGVAPRDQGEGDSSVGAFGSASDATRCALELQRRMQTEAWPDDAALRVRVALHSGVGEVVNGNYRGVVLSRAARLRALAHGGQTLISGTTQSLIDDHLPEGASLVDLGYVQLRDLDQPEHVFQLSHPDLPGAFPPLRISQAGIGNLPHQLTSFIGRERETREVIDRLNDHRLVTITGPGGSGKTRLSLKVAGDLAQGFADGVWLVDLGALKEPSQLPSTVVEALGLKHRGPGEATDTLLSHMRTRHALIVFDNCEHLREATASFVLQFLRACPAVKVLATSQELLAVPGEAQILLRPLSLPRGDESLDVDAAMRSESIRLFMDRARLADPCFEIGKEDVQPLVTISRRLDGLPLAIELAAAKVPILGLKQIQQRLDDRFALLAGLGGQSAQRQRTLRETVSWSHDLLPPTEQVLFRRLAVFPSHFSLEAAEPVCAMGDLKQVDILELLSRLVARSVVFSVAKEGERRFGMLETLRTFATERLKEADEETATMGRLIEWVESFAVRAEQGLRGPDEPWWLDLVHLEVPNIHAALDHADSTGKAHSALAIASSLVRFWRVRGSAPEGRARIIRSLALYVGDDDAVRAKALIAAGVLAQEQGDFAHARSLYAQALGIRRLEPPGVDLAEALLRSGAVEYATGNYDEAMELYNESLALRALHSDPWTIGAALQGVGGVRYWEGDLEGARQAFEESLGFQRESGDRERLSALLLSLGAVEFAMSNLDRASELFEESLALSRTLKNDGGVAQALVRLGAVGLMRDRFELARPLFEESLEIQRRVHDRQGEAASLHGLSVVADNLGDHETSERLQRESLALRHQIGDRAHIALSLEDLARVAGRARDFERAAVLFGAAHGLRAQIGAVIVPSDRKAHDDALREVEGELGEPFASLFEKGSGFNVDDAVAFALSVSTS
ncbi:MAG TPA: tetratricopeptide repeat protein [Actinomycetota bacterium]|nr:tetratricopeptide repeat protein [Actinomycetota bacterium]